MVDSEIMTAVKQSYGRCLVNTQFFDTFYDIFLKSSDKIPPMFKNTDFEKQKAVLRSTVTFVIMHAADTNAAFAKDKLQYVGDIHSRGKLNVAPELYPLWETSLMETIKQYDPEYTPELEKKWHQVLTPAIELLKSRY